MSAPKGSKALYRDLLRLIQHMAGTTSPKARHLRKIVASQFRENADVKDPARLHALRSSAERGLSNYLIFMNSKTDPKVAAIAADVGQYEDDAQGNLVKIADNVSSSGGSSRTNNKPNLIHSPLSVKPKISPVPGNSGGGGRKQIGEGGGATFGRKSGALQ